MGRVLMTYKVMPESVEIDLNNFEDEIKGKVISFGGEVIKVEAEEIAFGLKALKVIFSLDESKGDTEDLENDLIVLLFLH